MADAEKEKKEGEEKPAEAPKKSKKTLFIIIGVVGLLLLIGTPVLILTLGKKKTESANAELEDSAATKKDTMQPEGFGEEEELQEGEEPLGAIIPFETIVVNLSGGKYLRLQMQVEFSSRDIPKRFYGRVVPIRDSAISLLSQKTAEEIGSEKGRETLRSELKGVVDAALGKEGVKRIYFTQFLIQ